MKKGIAVLGSTGSIGRQTLDVVSAFPDFFEVFALATKGYLDIFEKQSKKFSPSIISIADKEFDAKRFSGSKILTGPGSLVKIAQDPAVDMLVMSIVGTAGLPATIAAIKKGKTIAIASKEILVAAGDVVMPLARKYEAPLLPLDSEHSAIFQCLQGSAGNKIKRLILTASGGPFRKYSKKQLEKVTAKQALSHPTWNMGPKITIDCATLMNKGLEVIEAHHLFNVPYEKIDVVVHPQSIIHSMVEFEDGSVLAQMGVPDMRTAIQYALFYPKRQARNFGTLDFAKIGTFNFEKPDTDRFPCLKLAYEAGDIGGTMPAVLSAANDSAVELFLNGKIKFTDIPKIVRSTMKKHKLIKKPSLDQILSAEKWARANSKF
ncbi:MAG: 1-deoxy-D-xylulose-5-phosphate reductoisomerase [Candidatus Margulisiibacteriota bacterium]